jgi:hypothetical protein
VSYGESPFSEIHFFFCYVEWLYIRESFLNVFSPFLQLQIFGTILTMPLFWVLTVVSVISFSARDYIDKHTEPRRPAEPVESAKSTRSRKTVSVTKRTSKSSRPTKESFKEQYLNESR